LGATVLDVDVVDAHHHLCRLSRASYPWLEGPPAPRYHGNDVALRRDYLLDDYLADASGLDELGARLVGSVHVENGAADPLAEGGWIDQVISEHPVPSVQVVKVDLAAPDARHQLAEQGRRGSVRGVRDILNWHPDSVYTHRDRPDLITDPSWLDGFRALADMGLSFDLQVFSHQLGQAADLADQFPACTIVLDHAGMPIGRGDVAFSEWRLGMRRLSKRPNVVTKVSALGTTDHAWTNRSVRMFVLETIDLFGPRRTMFGSNFPVDGLYSSYLTLYALYDVLTADFSRHERQDMFAGTAARTYRIELPARLGQS
jgi:predicted TIM-barrel fold metal-dependent hydrolase